MTPPDDNDIEGISIMEELDPEPARRQGLVHVRELILGLLLLVGVLGWASYMWWQSDTVSNYYAQGQQADTRRDWDNAFTYYSAAKDYKDANVRAANASRHIQKRNEQYEQAKILQQTGPAVLVLQAAHAVQTIEPGYADIDSVATQAEQQVYSEALSGTVVMRNAADPPGLYYRNSTSWVYLPGSDKWSNVLSYNCSDRVIYDVPGPGWVPPTDNVTPTPIPNQVPNGRPAPKERRLMQVARSDLDRNRAVPNSLSLEPADYDGYDCGADGVWGVTYQSQGNPSIAIPHSSTSFASSYTYEAYSGAITSTVALTGTQGTVVDLGAQGRHLLLAAYGEPSNGAPVEQLYLAGPDGSSPRVVYSTTGTILDAKLSLDERYLFVVSDYRESSSKLVVTGYLEDLESTAPPTPLAAVNFDVPVDDSLQGIFTVNGYFMDRGIFAGKLLLGWTAGANQIKLRLIDPSQPGQTLESMSIPGYAQSLLQVYEQEDGHTLVIYDEGVSANSTNYGAERVYLHVISVEGGMGTAPPDLAAGTSYTLTLNPRPVANQWFGFLAPKVADGSLIYQTENFSSQAGQDNWSVYSVPLAQLNEPSPQPQQIFNTILTLDNPRFLQQSWYEGSGMLAYTDKAGALHARLYNSDTDVMLEQGIGVIIGLDAYNRAGILR